MHDIDDTAHGKWIRGYSRGEGKVRGYVRGGKVEKVMHEFKAGELHSGSKQGPKVTNPKQAIAIAMSEAGKSKKMATGGAVPAPPPPKSPKPVMPKPTKAPSKTRSSAQVQAWDKTRQAGVAKKQANKQAMSALASVTPAYAKGGQIQIKTTPSTNVPPRSMNPKMRMEPKTRLADGGMAHSDAKQDKAMIKKAIKQHDQHMHGGKSESIILKKGGKISK